MAIINTIHTLQPYDSNYALPDYDFEAIKKEAESKDVFVTTGIIGNDQDNHLIGNAGDDYLNGGAGADILEGGVGDELYIVDDAGDVVIERANEGLDFVHASFSYTLTANVENLVLIGSGSTVFDSYESIDGTGNSLNNYIGGNAGNNYLSGLGGNDTLTGAGGFDTLEGGAGDDVYYVESLNDTVIEGANGGHDTAYLMFYVPDLETFDFSKFDNVEVLHFTNFSSTGEYFILEDRLSASKPTDLEDFEVKNDTICLSKEIFSKISKKGVLKKDAFWTGSKAHDKSDRVIYDKKKGDLYYDADGSGARKAVKFADVDKNMKMMANDFFVM